MPWRCWPSPLVSILVLVAILMGQAQLPFNRGLAGMGPSMAINTAVSFVTNTNWQSYAGESTLGYTAQAVGLTVQNFSLGRGRDRRRRRPAARLRGPQQR